MSYKEIENKLIDGDKYFNLQRQIETENLFNKIYGLVESHSEIEEDSPLLAEVIGAVSEALEGIEIVALEKGYNAGVKDTLQELKDIGITDIDLTKFDMSQFELTEEDKKAFKELEQEIENLDVDEAFSNIDFSEFNLN